MADLDEEEALEALQRELDQAKQEKAEAERQINADNRKNARHSVIVPIRLATPDDDEGELTEEQKHELELHLKEIEILKGGGSGRKSPMRASQLVYEDQQKKLQELLKLKEDILMGRATSPSPSSPSDSSSPRSVSPNPPPRHGSRKEQLAEVRKRTEELLNNPEKLNNLVVPTELRGGSGGGGGSGSGGGAGFFHQEVIKKQAEEIENLKRFIQSKGISPSAESQVDAEEKKRKKKELEDLRRQVENAKREKELELLRQRASETAKKSTGAPAAASAKKVDYVDDEEEEMLALQKRLAAAAEKKKELSQPSQVTKGASIALNEKERQVRELTNRLKEGGTQAENEARLGEMRRKVENSMYGVDVCFIMDCTGSMTDWIDITRKKIVELSHEVSNIKATRKPLLRIGFVGYRDVEYPIEEQFIKIDFFNIEDKNATKDFQDKLKAIVPLGGVDYPEDITGGMNFALKEMDWESSTKLVIHFADAPCHGRKYHDIEQEAHPNGCPRGLVPEKLLEEYASRTISYYFGEILEDTTRMMTDIFAAHMAKIKKSELFKVIPIASNTDQFLPEVVQSIAQSMKMSQLFGMQ